MIQTTIQLKLDTPVYNRFERNIRKGEQWAHNFSLWDVADVKRVERTDYLRVILERPEE